MKNYIKIIYAMKIVMFLVILTFFIFLSGCDTPRKDRPHVSGIDFCERFSSAFPGCWCTINNNGEYSVIYKTGSTANNTMDVEAFVGKYYFDNIVIPNNLIYEEVTCQNIGYGFYNCNIGDNYFATFSDGDLYKTECGV